MGGLEDKADRYRGLIAGQCQDSPTVQNPVTGPRLAIHARHADTKAQPPPSGCFSERPRLRHPASTREFAPMPYRGHWVFLETRSWSNLAAPCSHSLTTPRSSSNAPPAASLLFMVERAGHQA